MAKTKELTISDKLKQLADLQAVHAKLDSIHIMKGELPIEVADLEDEITGLNTRISKLQSDINEKETDVADRKITIKDAQANILKYEKQINTVKNNREFDALTKELELQKLEIQLCEKKIKDASFAIDNLEEGVVKTKAALDNKEKILEEKKQELKVIVGETEKEEADLEAKASKLSEEIDVKYLNAYSRIRKNYRNGLAVVKVQRNSCGGCFGKIPLQTQSVIRTKKMVITCDHCGRILYDVEEWETTPTIVIEE